MANLRLTNALRNDIAQDFQLALDAGAGAGTCKIYDGTQPATADTALGAQVLLATLTFSDPSAGAASAGVLTFSPIGDDVSADATGTATWARCASSTPTTVFDCDVNTTGATLNFNTVAFVAGATIKIISFSITIPAG